MDEEKSYFQIYIQGHLNTEWSDWLDSFSIQHKENGISVLTGAIKDNAELHSLLDRLFDLNICILSLRRLGFHPEGKIVFPV